MDCQIQVAGAGIVACCGSRADADSAEYGGFGPGKGQIQVPEGYPSTAAAEMLKDIQGSEGGGALHSTLLVFHNETGLTDTDFAEIAEGRGSCTVRLRRGPASSPLSLI